MANIIINDLYSDHALYSVIQENQAKNINGGCGTTNGGQDIDLDGCSNRQTRKLIRYLKQINS